MPSNRLSGQFRSASITLGSVALTCVALAVMAGVQTRPLTSSRYQVLLEEIGGTVEFLAAGTTNWLPAKVGQALNPGDWLRTRERSRAAVRVGESVIRKSELTTVEIQRAPPGRRPTLDVKSGLLYFFSRDKPRELRLRTPLGAGAIRGTEFNLAVAIDGTTVLTLIDGEVELSNDQATVRLVNGEAGKIEPGKAPTKTAVLQSEAVNLIQWCLYYPAVLDPAELGLSTGEQQALSASLAAYRRGDLVKALQVYPQERTAASSPEQVYHAALLLSVGQVDQARAILENVKEAGGSASPVPKLARALSLLIATVKLQPRPYTPAASPSTLTVTELMAESYYLQSRAQLAEALAAAKAAAASSQEFGFAWTRVAELEFSFGRTRQAKRALEKALRFSPRDAQARALKGFLLAAEGNTQAALASFEEAIRLDGALGNGWLGRGLCRIRLGRTEEGREDLQMAAALEPQRALLRSYLGKAFSHANDRDRAARELELAKRLDPHDPTAWLYSGLLNREELRFNDGIRDVEHSQELNENRRLFRSKLLLDQDRAVRGVNLATLYQQAGMPEVSLREAARAVTYDYGNYSAHLFLAQSFDALRDPTRFNLREETAWFNELLLGHLLAPVGADTLSQQVTPQEYSRLFEANRIGFSSDTQYRSDGQLREQASQFGTVGGAGYALDVEYQHNDGVRPNNDLSRLEWYTRIKQQLTAEDSLFLLAKYQDYSSGDNFQYVDPANARPQFRFDEFQTPILVGGYHREWRPGVHTLFLAGRLENEQRESDAGVPLLMLAHTVQGQLNRVQSIPFDVQYQNKFEIYTAELNQIVQGERHTSVAGARFQTGQFQTRTVLPDPLPQVPGLFSDPAAGGEVTDDFQRLSVYGYHTWEVVHDLFATAGLSYDQLTYPANHRLPPIVGGEARRHRLNPKAALAWTPSSVVTLRGSYTRSLGGVSFDESFRLEPVQLAGFSQGFRTVIPESVVGSVSAPTFETYGAAVDLRLRNRTYLGIQGEFLRSEVEGPVGVFDWTLTRQPIRPGSTPQRLAYQEPSLAVTLNQLIGSEWSLGARYKFTRSELHTVFPEIPVALVAAADRTETADLHEIGVYALFNHRSGFFGRVESQWFLQHSAGYAAGSPELAGESFPQVNLSVGYRLRRQRGELSVSLQNLTAEDYRLNPLNVYPEFPRERVAQLRFRFTF